MLGDDVWEWGQEKESCLDRGIFHLLLSSAGPPRGSWWRGLREMEPLDHIHILAWLLLGFTSAGRPVNGSRFEQGP